MSNNKTEKKSNKRKREENDKLLESNPKKSVNKDVKKFVNKIENLSDLINLSFSTEKYENISIDLLKNIRKELIELNLLSGLKKIKQSILDQILYYIQGLHSNSDDYLHTIITGPAGSGKTTIAKILGRIFSKLGVLSESKFIIARRDNFVAGYLGQTAIKTQKLLESSQGGVLFIDEVYSMGNPRTDGDSFSKEAIDTINLFLSEYKDDFMMIVAGYEKEVEECFFAHNHGLKRRFMWHHKIDGYDPRDLVDILKLKIYNCFWKLDDDVTDDYLTELITSNIHKFQYNGGDIENFFSMCKVQHARRSIYLNALNKKKISRQDLDSSIEKFKNDIKKEDELPPFMYL